MQRFFQPQKDNQSQEMVSVSITSIGEFDFQQIDSSIKQTSPWRRRIADYTEIEFPKSKEIEILEKLKTHGSITAINGEVTFTPRSPAFHSELDRRLKGGTPVTIRFAFKSVLVGATAEINFSKIDPAMKNLTAWCQDPSMRILIRSWVKYEYPIFVKVGVSEDRLEEMIAKLKAHAEIVSVNGELTARGIAIEEAKRTTHPQFSA